MQAEIRLIPIAEINVGNRLREIDIDWATMLAGMLEQQGLMHPIEVRPMSGKYDLVAGAHRLAAAEILGWTEITATIREASDMEAELRQIDENLGRRELSPFDRATFLARRQELYLEVYPDTTRGGTGAATRWHAAPNLSFATEIAAKLGVSDRDIRRHIARYRSIAPDVRAKIAGTWIADNGVALDALARETPTNQRKAIVLMLAPTKPIKSVAAAIRQANGAIDAPADVDAEQFRRLQDAWGRAGNRAKNQFLTWMFANSSREFLVGVEAALDEQISINEQGGQ